MILRRAVLLLSLCSSTAYAADYGSITIPPITSKQLDDYTMSRISGWIDGIYLNHDIVTIRKRNGDFAIIDISKAMRAPDFPSIGIEQAITATGRQDKLSGILHADSVAKAPSLVNTWPTDR